MPDKNTRADSLELRHSGASSEGAAQADPEACLGDYMAADEVQRMVAELNGDVGDVTVDQIDGANGVGVGVLTAASVDSLTWTAPDGSPGAAVTILNGQTKIMEDAGDPAKFIRVTRNAATDLGGSVSLILSEVVNAALAGANVADAERAAGSDTYHGLFLVNRSAAVVKNIVAHLGPLGTPGLSDTVQLGSSGSGTPGNGSAVFADWPDSGFCLARDSGDFVRELFYYSSRTASVLTVPAAGRGLLGTSASAGAATDMLYPHPGFAIAKEFPAAQPAGPVQTIASLTTAPTSVTWVLGTRPSTGLSVGDLAAGYKVMLWFWRAVVAGATAEPLAQSILEYGFEAG